MNLEVGPVALPIADISFDGLQRGRMTRVGWSSAISLLSPGVTKPFVQGHNGNHKPLACQQLCLYLGRWDPARTTSCQFDGAPGARRDVGIHAELSPRHKNVRPRLREHCLLPRFSSDEVHLTRNSGSEVSKVVLAHLDAQTPDWIFLPDFWETSLFSSSLLNVAYMIHVRNH